VRQFTTTELSMILSHAANGMLGSFLGSFDGSSYCVVQSANRRWDKKDNNLIVSSYDDARYERRLTPHPDPDDILVWIEANGFAS